MDFVYDKYLNDLFGSENFGEPHSKEQRKQDKNKQGESTKGGKNRQGKDGTKHWLEEEYLPRLQCSKPKYTLSSETLKTFCPENVDESQLSEWFPPGSVFVKLNFELDKPYTSKSDKALCVTEVTQKRKGYKFVDNPIVRDTLTDCPMVRPSTWKGNLRFAAQKVIEEDLGADTVNQQMIVNRLFGSESIRGRLYFFPTFFPNSTEQYVITPLSRETRTPKRGPIPIEIVPPGTKGTLYLLYFPYPKGHDYTEKQVVEDIEFLAKAVKEMLYTYGFSAKKTSGFGTAKKLPSDNGCRIIPDKYHDCFRILWGTDSDDGRREEA